MVVDSFRLELPVSGTETKDWIVNFFVDHNPNAKQVTDFRGGKKTYDGHTGTDFNVPNFRFMDGDFAVYASAGGLVIALHDGEPDRNTSRAMSRGGYGNHVKL